MKQLTQNLKEGKMEVLEVPVPAVDYRMIQVRNHYSIISAGTEGKTVTDARKGYIAKARTRQKEVKQVINLAKEQGVVDTYKIVMSKLDAYTSLGYSCSGEIIAVGPGVNGFKIGDMVACAGAGASHAEIVSVSKNLCAKIPSGVYLKHGALTTIAAIALQGIRQADLKLGENCVVIGLGLLGQLTIQLLNAAGIHSFGIDIDQVQVALAKKCGATLALDRSNDGIVEIINNATLGYGSDAVIITAGTSSLDPVELAGELCRKKGKVIIVGAVPTGFSRGNYYKKELDLRMSSSYGPGRYDPQYEEKGIDYPYGYVRWTENRNMQAYLQLLADNKLNIKPLITHEFPFEKAPDAYDMILNKTEPFTGIVLKYNPENVIRDHTIQISEKAYPRSEVNIGFVGAGSFAQNMLLPKLKGFANLTGVADAKGNTSRYIAEKYDFGYATSDTEKIMNDDSINTVFIATRHDSHAKYVLESLRSGKNVYTEKPLALKLTELEEIKHLYHDIYNNKFPIPSSQFPKLMIGFNRRFAPHSRLIKDKFSTDLPKAIMCRINAGKVPADHWVQDPEIGGGRIIGEVCHFIDLAMFYAGHPINMVSAQALKQSQNLHDTLIVNLGFTDGSIATINYFSNGNNNLPKEYIEIFSGDQVAVIDDFKSMVLYHNKKEKHKLSKQDKGHSNEVKAFINAIKNGSPAPIPFDELYLSTLATFKVLESLQTGQTINI